MRAVALFVPPPQRWAAGHRGIDLAAAPYQAVVAPADGIVAFAGPVVGRGVITIDHGGGLISSLEPVENAAAAGTPVGRGEPVAVVAQTAGHCAPATCVHWGVRVDGAYVDPLDLLMGFGPVRLMPIRSARAVRRTRPCGPESREASSPPRSGSVTRGTRSPRGSPRSATA
ncbi:M23 family metallopeptidase [Demequina sp.]|uniref:murein hydrolase activator EnvC family protein n=1 Tax=Demequina sp. TaxID=2050685 RepID=UPI0025F82246|nr:M23 family metallopeptidase [Demequina sp.]